MRQKSGAGDHSYARQSQIGLWGGRTNWNRISLADAKIERN